MTAVMVGSILISKTENLDYVVCRVDLDCLNTYDCKNLNGLNPARVTF